MPAVEFVGQSRQDSDNISASTSRLINFYREPVGSEITSHVLKSVLGTQVFSTLPQPLVRSLERVDGIMYAAAGGRLFSVGAGTSVELGEIIDDENTGMSGNFGAVGIVAGGNYYLYDSPTITQPTAGAFDDFGSIDYLGGFTLLTERDGRRFQWSGIALPGTLGALDFQTADSRDDNIVRGVVTNDRYLIMKERSTEVWYRTGEAGVEAWRRVAGGTIDTGLKAYGLVTKFSGGLFFIGDDNTAYITQGGLPTPISVPNVETAIRYSTPTSCFTYEDEGHKFLCIRFSDRTSYCYDLSTGEWHERAEGPNHDPWTITGTVESGGDWYGGTESGRIVKLARLNVDVGEVLADVGLPLRRTAVSKTLYQGNRRFRVRLLEFLGRVGRSALGGAGEYLLEVSEGYVLAVGVDTVLSLGTFDADPRPAQIWIRVSRDGGNTWGDEKMRSFGDLGEYMTRAVYRSMGQFRKLTVELNCSEDAEIPINATAMLEVV